MLKQVPGGLGGAVLVVLSPECCGGERPRTEDVGTVPPGPLGKSVPSSTFPCAEPHRCHLEGAQGPGEEAPPGWFCSELCRLFPLIFFFFLFFLFPFYMNFPASGSVQMRRPPVTGETGAGWQRGLAARDGERLDAAGALGARPHDLLCACVRVGRGSSPAGGGPHLEARGVCKRAAAWCPLFFLQFSEAGRAQQRRGKAGYRLRASCP